MKCFRPVSLSRLSGPISCSLLLVLFSSSVWAADKEAFFETRVRPILVDRCVSCHGAKKQESALRLDSRDAMLEGGDSGPAVVAGDVDTSLLIEAIRRDGLEMPPDEPLNDDEVEVLEEWVRQGAPWPTTDAPTAPALGDQDAIGTISESHWAFQPVQKPDVPSSSDERNPIDAFVRKTLNASGLQPAASTDRRTLIRRAYFGLIGLPPSLDEIRAFEIDESPAAFENVVDRLLASDHYGERWARHWLDIARYADTREWLAANADTRYPFAWTYRDYVINAFNDDKPYDQFLKEQIAADFYTDEDDDPSLAALGFLTVGSRFRNKTEELVADQLDVITRGTMALTVACARCHDHKYDPVPAADYYSLYGVLASTSIPEDLPVIRSAGQDAQLLSDYEKARAEKTAEFDVYGTGLQTEAHEHVWKNLPKYFTAYYEMGIARSAQVLGVLLKHKVKETAAAPVAKHLEQIRTDPKRAADPVWGPWVVGLNIKTAEFKEKWPDVLKTLQSEAATNAVILGSLSSNSINNRRQLVNVYARTLQRVLKKDSALSTAEDEIYQALAGDDGVLKLTVNECLNASKVLGPNRTKLAKYQAAIREVDVNHPGSPPRAMRVADSDTLMNPYVMLRGESSRRGDKVPRQFLSILSGADRQPFVNGSGRQELAEAIANPGNPLTARVIVNRVWMKYFGRGFVETPGDFGLRCDPPTHPELLDWLAATFIEDGWSLKKLHRRILLSQTFQQSSAGSELSGELDPDNRLLSHVRRRRLDFEAMRDAMLSTSGQIDLTVGGRSVQLFEAPFARRRSVYGYIDRVKLEPLLKVFDFPSPYAAAPERAETTIPQQSLFAMNHPFVVDQARQLANRVRNEPTAHSQVNQLYEHVFGRTATDRETQIATAFVMAPVSDAPSEPGVWHYGYGRVISDETSDVGFHEFPHWTGQHYQPSDIYPDSDFGHLRLSTGGGHPGRNGIAVVHRWVAPANGRVRVDCPVQHRRDKGDGVDARIVLNGRNEIAGVHVFNAKKKMSASGVDVKAGDTIDLIVDSGTTTVSDGFSWAPVITGKRGVLNEQTWSARDGFRAPPPPPLDSLEQFAQALLLTNEFLYLD